MAKPVSVEEMLAQIDKILEENEMPPHTGIRAAPTGPATPILPTATIDAPAGITTFQSPVGPVLFAPDADTDIAEYAPDYDNSQPSGNPHPRHFPIERLHWLFSSEELITRLEQQTEESLYQAYIEKFTRITGGSPSPLISDILRARALVDYTQGRYSLAFLQNPPCPVEREQLDRYGELFEVSRERIRQRAYPHLT